MDWKRIFGFAGEKPRAVERTPQTMQVGDGVDYGGENYVVEQRIEYRGDGGDVWWDHLLSSPERKLWLGVVEDEGLELTIYEKVPYVPDFPLPTRIAYEGQEFKRLEHGFATAYVHKPSGTTMERVEYWDHQDPSNRKLSIERWGLNDPDAPPSEATGTVVVSLGKPIPKYAVKIYPGGSEGE